MTDSLQISHKGDDTSGTYSMDVDGANRPAVLTWRAKGDARVAEHTFTPPQARGTGIAFKLVAAMIHDAREHGFTIVPQCPYVAKQFDKHPEWADLRAAS